ncbi:MAG: SigE family RNA polymerase sigma factor [Actinobacteria bacterium]|nr:SigE family RNA polymerase sigma factor [Actinomycetota bacterium]MBV9252815.1 SigE family RNA polymerase sigma factor [Actinomycetota bacterium]MBV9666003.1 SigE family RNA polymerase sigma factor [Actinomycetota bacterium]MBV9936161.1 SigE family RNA polymerase sigma factor [Actinomycetota bacterium]
MTMAFVGATTADSEAALADLFRQHYRSLFRLAALLLEDAGTSEDVVQEAYIRVLARLERIRDPEATLGYLRQTVVNLSRSALRRRRLATLHDRSEPRAVAAPEDAGLAAFERAAVVHALRKLPRHQREAVVLRYYGDLSEAQTAIAMGVSTGAVKSSTSRGLAALAAHLEALR